MPETELKTKITVDTSGLKAGTEEAAAQFRKVGDQIKGSFSELNSHVSNQISSLAGAFKMLGPAIAGAVSIAGIKSAIDGALSYNASVLQLSRTMGMTTEAASRLSAGLKLIGMSTEEYSMINMRLGNRIKNNEDELTGLGVATRNVNTGALLPQSEILQNVINRMKDYKEGADRIQFAEDAIGARGALAAMQLLKLKDAMAIATPIAKELGLELGEKQALAMERLGMQFSALGLSLDALKVKIGTAILSDITKLFSYFAKEAPTYINATITALKSLISVFEVVKMVGGIALDAIAAPLYAIADILAGVFLAAVKVFKGDFIGAWDAIKMGTADAKTDFISFFNLVKERTGEASKNLANIWKVAKPEKEEPTKKGKEETYKRPETESRLPKWEQELKQMQIDEKRFFGLSVAEERAFWDEKLALTRTGSEKQRKERLEVQNKIFEVDKRGAKEQYDLAIAGSKMVLESDQTLMADKLAALDRNIALAASTYGKETSEYANAVNERIKKEEEFNKHIETVLLETDAKIRESNAKRLEDEIRINDQLTKTARDYYENRFKLGEVSSADLARVETQLEAQRYDTEQNLLDQLTTLWAMEPDKFQATLDKMKIAKEKNAQELQKIDQQYAEQNKKNWEEIASAMTGALHTAVKGIILGTTTLQKSLANLFQSILVSFVDLLIKKMIDEWLLGELKKMNISQIYAALRTALFGEEAVTAIAEKKIEAAVVIPAETGEAAMGAAASVAPTPFIGPALATAAYAAMMKLGAGALAMAEGAEGGWDVDQSKMVFAHKGEMILPAGIAEGFRAMFAGGGGGGGWKPNQKTFADLGSAYGKAHGKAQGKALVNVLRGATRNLGFKR